MKKNGFTLVEILISFSLASIVVILLLNVIIIMKNLYVEDGMKTNLLIHQANFTKRMQDVFHQSEVTEVNVCGDNCLQFVFLDGSNKTLSYNEADSTFSFDNYKIELAKGTKVGKFSAETKTITTMQNPVYNDSILTIKVPITHKLIDGEYGINFVYPYNSHVTLISVT